MKVNYKILSTLLLVFSFASFIHLTNLKILIIDVLNGEPDGYGKMGFEIILAISLMILTVLYISLLIRKKQK